MSGRNYIIWKKVEEAVSHYYMWSDMHQSRFPDLEARIRVRRLLKARIRFFADNGLMTVNPFAENGDLIDCDYRESEFTAEGLELWNRQGRGWLESEGAQKDPPDMRILEEALAQIRAGKKEEG